MEHVSNSICRSCRMRLSQLPQSRGFSSTVSRSVVPPESPAYIDVPSSHQVSLPWRRQRKGTLPIPREIFPSRRPDKSSPQYLDNVTKNPSPHNIKDPETLSEYGQYRLRMHERRKSHLREGLTELHRRKQVTEAKISHRSFEKQIERAQLVAQAPREDERLTSNSVPAAMQPRTASSTRLADDLAAAKAVYERKKANADKHTTAKHAERMDALHTLYMSARTFITTPEQLNTVLEQQFRDPDIFRSDSLSQADSIWNTGPPDTVKDMIASTLHDPAANDKGLGSLRAFDSPARTARFERDQARLQKIAEKLSGGKI